MSYGATVPGLQFCNSSLFDHEDGELVTELRSYPNLQVLRLAI